MSYYVFGPDLEKAKDALNSAGIEAFIVHDTVGILPSTYIQVKTDIYNDTGLWMKVRLYVPNYRSYIILKELQGTKPLV